MRESDYYAPGSYNDPLAPWNQVDIPKREFDCVATFTITKHTEVESSCYSIYNEPDGSYVDTDDISWKDEYYEQHYTPLQLIDMYKKELEEKKKYMSNLYEIHKIEHIIKECENWDEEEVEIYEDK